MQIDWSQSSDIEVVPEKVSGRPLVKDTRIPADMLVGYYESRVQHGMQPEKAFMDTAENYPGAGPIRLRRILDYACAHTQQPQS